MRFFQHFLWLFFAFFSVAQAQKSEFGYGQHEGLSYRFLGPPCQLEVPGAKFPLVIFLHGAGERGDDRELPLKHIEHLFLDSLTQMQYPCFVLVPQCPKAYRWVETDWTALAHRQPEQASVPMSQLISLIARWRRDPRVDTQRLYLMGLSMGGFGTWDLLARRPEWFAAGIPVCGGGDEQTAGRLLSIPIWAFHGKLDKVVKVSRSQNMVKALRQKGGKKIQYTEYPDVQHDSWKRAFREPKLMPWLFGQCRAD